MLLSGLAEPRSSTAEVDPQEGAVFCVLPGRPYIGSQPADLPSFETQPLGESPDQRQADQNEARPAGEPGPIVGA
jgi:hypothetical protein